MNNLIYKIFLYSIFLILSVIIYPCSLYSQKKSTISLHEKNIPIREVLNKIEKETEYSMAYRSKLNLEKQITVSFNNTKLDKALEKILEGTDFSYKIKGYHIIIFYDENKNQEPEELPIDTVEKEIIRLPNIQYDFSKNTKVSKPEPIRAKANIASIEIPPAPKKEKETFLVIKNNILFDAALIQYLNLNLGAEVRLSDRYTLDIFASYNPWSFENNKKMKHVLIQPEIRYWFDKSFSGHFVGLHAHWSYYNIGNISLPVKLNYRYEGWMAGAGISYGYQWKLNSKWSMEANIGVGYANIQYEQYEYPVCGDFIKEGNKNYIGLTKAGITISYKLK